MSEGKENRRNQKKAERSKKGFEALTATEVQEAAARTSLFSSERNKRTKKKN